MSEYIRVKGNITEKTGGTSRVYAKGGIEHNSNGFIDYFAESYTYGEPEDPPENIYSKKIIDMYWTYGDTKLFDKSRFYVDMNLVIKTINYKEGEIVEVCIKSEDGQPLTDQLTELNLRKMIGKDNIVTFEKVLKDYTLNLLELDDKE